MPTPALYRKVAAPKFENPSDRVPASTKVAQVTPYRHGKRSSAELCRANVPPREMKVIDPSSGSTNASYGPSWPVRKPRTLFDPPRNTRSGYAMSLDEYGSRYAPRNAKAEVSW